MPIRAQAADGSIHEFPDGTAPTIVDGAMKKYATENPSADVSNDNVDQSGAPAHVRALVGSMPDAKTRLDALRKHFPDAQPHGDDNFVYTDPKTKKPTLYNPEGLDMGDFASLVPEAAEAVGAGVGAVAGGAAGTTVAPGPGTVAGAMGGAGYGAVVGRELAQSAAMKLAGVKEDRTVGEHAADNATTFVLNSGGQGLGMGVGAGGRALVRGVARGGAAGRTATQQAIADLDRFGAAPSAAQATENAALDSFESIVAKVPGGAGVIRQAAQKQSDQVAKSVSTKIATMNSNIAPNTLAAGNAATEGVESFVRNFGDKADALYSKLDSFMPSDTAVKVSNTERVLNQIVTPAKGAANVSKTLANPKLVQLADALGKDSSNGAVTYSVMKDLRSSIGRRLGSSQLTDDIPRAELKRVYGALSDDLRLAAQERGPDAIKAFDRAGTYYKSGMDRIDAMLAPIVQNKLPEQVFATLESAGKQGPTRLRALRKSVNQEQWRTIAGTVADRLGRSAPGQQGEEVANFSFQKFLTNWQKLDPQAKDVLFSGPNMNGIRGDMDALARVSERIRDSSKAFATPAGTPGGVAGITMLFGGGGAAIAGHPGFLLPIAGAIGGSHLAARLLTSGRFVKWLAQATRVAPNGLGAHIGRLSAIAADSDADTRDAIKGFADNLANVKGQ